MTHPTYRKAIPTDAPQITNFQLLMAKETEDLELDLDICTQGVKAVFADPSKGEYFVAELDGKVVASLMITYEWSDWRNGVVWWIQSVYVDSSARGHGVFKGLYNHVKEIVLADKNIRGIRLYVDKTNINAQEVYNKLGMNGQHYSLCEWLK